MNMTTHTHVAPQDVVDRSIVYLPTTHQPTHRNPLHHPFKSSPHPPTQAPEINILLSPDPYPHWTIRECLEQPEAIARALAFGGRMSDTRVFLGGLDRQKERMRGIQHMVRAPGLDDG